MKHIRLIGLIALLLAAIACGSSEDLLEATEVTPAAEATETEGEEPAADEPESEEEAAEPTEVPTATPEDVGVAVYALEVVDPAVASDIADIDEGDRLVAVRVAIENTSGMPISINPLNLTLLDENGIVHEAELGALEGLDQLSTFTLYTNERVAGWVSFAVEEGMSPATVKFSESIISAEGVTDDVTNIEVPEWEPIAEEPATNLGDTVSGLGVELTSLVVTDPAQASSFYTAEEGVHIVAVEVRLRNADASDTVSANPFYFYLVDNLGFVHTAELGSTAQEQIAPRDLASGEAVEGVIGFEVPDGRTPLYIRYAANFFDDTEFLEVGLTE